MDINYKNDVREKRLEYAFQFYCSEAAINKANNMRGNFLTAERLTASQRLLFCVQSRVFYACERRTTTKKLSEWAAQYWTGCLQTLHRAMKSSAT
jgi:hypothetical protein